MKVLTEKQKSILTFIKDYKNKCKYPPTVREIAKAFSISAKGAYDHLKALKKKNQIRGGMKLSRAIEILDEKEDNEKILVPVPLLGNVAAGTPLFAEENFDGTINLPSSLIKNDKCFALNVKGDSMVNAGILDGDIAVFLQENHAENGDIVIARVNDEAVTLKKFYKEKNRIMLKAENPAYPPIYTQDVKILGKLKHILRNYE